jgi:hypothetical protein
MTSAAIRYNNPGAMWGNKLAIKWGANPKAVTLNDGLGQGNNIAVFPTPLQGACAQMDLWRSNYAGMTLAAADKKWSGGNSSAAYINFLCSKVPGLTPNTVISREYLAGPNGWKLMKYQAQWEAGQPYPNMTDGQWQEAQRRVFSGKAPVSKTTKIATATTAVVVATGGAASQASHWPAIILVVVMGLIVAGVVALLIHQSHEEHAVAKQPDTPKAEGHP